MNEYKQNLLYKYPNHVKYSIVWKKSWTPKYCQYTGLFESTASTRGMSNTIGRNTANTGSIRSTHPQSIAGTVSIRSIGPRNTWRIYRQYPEYRTSKYCEYSQYCTAMSNTEPLKYCNNSNYLQFFPSKNTTGIVLLFTTGSICRKFRGFADVYSPCST